MLITPNRKREGQQHCRVWTTWTTYLNRAMLSDGSHSRFYNSNCRTNLTKIVEFFIARTCDIMVWRAIACYSKWSLVCIQSTLMVHQYMHDVCMSEAYHKIQCCLITFIFRPVARCWHQITYSAWYAHACLDDILC